MPESHSTGRSAPAEPVRTPQGSTELDEVRDCILAALPMGTAYSDGSTAEDVANAVIVALGLERVECRFCGMADDGPCEDGQEHAYLWLIGDQP